MCCPFLGVITCVALTILAFLCISNVVPGGYDYALPLLAPGLGGMVGIFAITICQKEHDRQSLARFRAQAHQNNLETAASIERLRDQRLQIEKAAGQVAQEQDVLRFRVRRLDSQMTT